MKFIGKTEKYNSNTTNSVPDLFGSQSQYHLWRVTALIESSPVLLLQLLFPHRPGF